MAEYITPDKRLYPGEDVLDSPDVAGWCRAVVRGDLITARCCCDWLQDNDVAGDVVERARLWVSPDSYREKFKELGGRVTGNGCIYNMSRTEAASRLLREHFLWSLFPKTMTDLCSTRWQAYFSPETGVVWAHDGRRWPEE